MKMKNNSKYGEITSQLAMQKPELQNEQNLTDQILQSIKEKPQVVQRKWSYYAQIASTAAAVLLLLLFVFQYDPKHDYESNRARQNHYDITDLSFSGVNDIVDYQNFKKQRNRSLLNQQKIKAEMYTD
ncbi:hypothetical protein LJC37_00605 [Bacteroidales bacterium OttesenSCG-928-E04]|nr:hypothetical protein [Bacteroidales bacterium OttesenSCG-928-E04]